MRLRELNIYEKCISIVGKCKKKPGKVGFVVKKFLSHTIRKPSKMDGAKYIPNFTFK